MGASGIAASRVRPSYSLRKALNKVVCLDSIDSLINRVVALSKKAFFNTLLLTETGIQIPCS